MSQATKQPTWLSWLYMGLTLAFSAEAQTIGDYSRSQRAVLESEMAKNAAKVLGNVHSPSLPNPTSLSLASRSSALLPPLPGAAHETIPVSLPEPVATPEPELVVQGVMVSSKRSMVELSIKGRTVLLLSGDKVPGTAWIVTSIRQDLVILKSGTQRKIFNLYTGAW